VPLLDTNVFVDLMRGRDPGRQRSAANAVSRLVTPDEGPATTRFTISELLLGVERADHPDVQRKKTSAVLQGVEILEFDEAAMLVYPLIAAELMRLGKPTETMDLLIATVAIANRRVLLTRNPRHFENIPGLRMETY
jgi:predicted nucleic acid-binding protein